MYDIKLEKEACDAALTRLLRPYFAKVAVQDVYHDINRGHSIDEDGNLLTLLIMQHFNNPPLEFEELKEGMPIWDNKSKEWCLLVMKDKSEILQICGVDWETYVRYEPYRFYRKEVTSA